MNKVAMLLDQLHDVESSLADDYRKIGERHASDHDLWHSCHTFARQCEARAAQIREAGVHYGRDIGEPHDGEVFHSLAARARRAVAELIGRPPSAGVLMLRDLRELYLAAEEANLEWIMLGQVAQAARDGQLLQLVELLHRQVVSQIKWLKSQVKEATPQALLT